MNAALLLSAVLIMAPVTALINTITSHWKSLRGKLCPGERAQRHGGVCAQRRGSTLSREGPAGRTAGRTDGQLDGQTHCCDFVVHHCPCLMAAWLFLSRCCDNAKCPFYERQRSSSPSTVNTPTPQTACPQQTGHAMKNNLLLSLGVHLHTFRLNI